MKAVRLLATSKFLALVALVAVFALGSVASADEADLKSALEDYAAGRYEQALPKLQAYVASNPDDSEVYGILRDTEDRLIIRVLAQGGEHQRLMEYLLDKSKPGAAAEAMSDDAIQATAQEAVESDAIDKRRRASAKLRRAGALAVPYLYPYLGSSSHETVVNAILALRQLGGDATLALAETMQSSNANIRRYAAAVLADSGDSRAIPALSAATSDDDPGIAEKASAALAKMGAEAGSASAAYTALGNRYYSKDLSLATSFDSTKNMWRWEGDALVRYEVPYYLYAYQMAEECAIDALNLDAGNGAARALLVRALLAQRVEAQARADNAPEGLADGAFNLAESQGFGAASAALAASIANGDWDVAVECCDLVRATYGDETLEGHPLGDALVAPHKHLRYSAAIAALHMSPKSNLPNSDKVAALAAQAASESALRQVLVIDDNEATRSKLLIALAQGGYIAAAEGEGTEGVIRAKSAPTIDVVVVRADLGDQANTISAHRHNYSLGVIDELTRDARTRDMSIIVLLQDTADSKKDAIKNMLGEKYGDKIKGFIEVPVVETAALDTVATAAEAKDLSPDQDRANALAAEAAGAFAAMDFSCRTFDLGVAIEPLSTAATEGPTGDIRMNAVMALGNLRVGGADALVKVLNEGDSDDIKVAAAAALGQVLGSNDATPEQIDALVAAAGGEGAVAAAALKALGGVRNLSDDQRNALIKAHRLQVASKAE
ncbi:MAG: HEAT repeat domain-containing protein [Planctomycetota bacterium]|nr:HEAT repeat domain-containing protein [Planctomycetota bacterium]